MNKNKIQQFLQAALFWDVDANTLDIDIHARFIIERVIVWGDLDDWKMLLKLYGKKRTRDEVVNIRFLDSKSLNFLSVYFNIEVAKFRCCN